MYIFFNSELPRSYSVFGEERISNALVVQAACLSMAVLRRV